MIEYLVTAFFVAQPVQPAMAASTGVNRTPGAVEITSKRVSFSRDQATFKEDVAVKHQTMDLRCDELTAHYAQYNGKYTATRGECMGNVRAMDGERTARGERAEFDVPTGMLVVTGNPEAWEPTVHLQGAEVRLTLGNQNFEVKDATVTFQSAPLKVKTSQQSNPVVTHAKRVSGTRGQAVFTGDVVVKHRTMDLRCDKLTTYLNGPREVSRADCVGNVRAVDGDRRAKGERARFDVPTGVLVVTGNPEAEDPMIYFRGAEVRMTLGGQSFEGDDATVVFKTAPLKEQQRKRKGTPGGAVDDTDKPGGTKQP
ncbi:LptA/OstA family protein [Archangium sp.]|uniref:LptA/OstA family protein n=1 Tax=Archangium sp. TaxID=1872627 RepID=UPI002D510C50|nr:LptA/OstA family protein [Archangium sp.]HYO55135.1 LptA/OstA family protein [Archangium sp.]